MLLFCMFLVAVFVGIPIGFAFAISGIIFLLNFTPLPPKLLVTVSFAGIDSFSLMALPFFIFAGDIMRYGGVSKRLIDFAKVLSGKSTSALGTITVLGSAFFGAVSGSAAATVAAIGGIMIPEMQNANYKKEYSVTIASASGYLGILIPPSIPLVVYGVTANISIGDLFIGGIVPGFLAAVVFIVLNRFYCPKKKDGAQSKPVGESIGKAVFSVIPGLLMPVIILGGIYGGIFTATEAAAVAIFYGLFVAIYIYKEITIRDIMHIAMESAYTSAKILFIIALATFFGRLMTFVHLPQQIGSLLLSISDNPIAILLLINVLLLLLGMVMETSVAILVTVPFLMPITASIGMDPVHFGVMVVFNLAIGLITPPMALNLFVGAQISGVPVGSLVRPIMPFVLSSIAALMLVAYVPSISLGLLRILEYLK